MSIITEVGGNAEARTRTESSSASNVSKIKEALKIGGKIVAPVVFVALGAALEYKFDTLKPAAESTTQELAAKRIVKEMERADKLSKKADSRSAIGNAVLNSLGKQSKDPKTGKIIETGMPASAWIVSNGTELVMPCDPKPLTKEEQSKYKQSGRDGQNSPFIFDLDANDNFSNMVVNVQYGGVIMGSGGTEHNSELKKASFYINDSSHADRLVAYASSLCARPVPAINPSTTAQPSGTPAVPNIPKP